MNRLLSFLTGSARVRLECASPEAFLNLCAEQGIRFRAARRVSETEVSLTTDRAGLKALRTISSAGGFTIVRVRTEGLSFLPRRLRNRWLPVAFAALCLVMLWLSSLYIWDLTVSGNDRLSEYEILAVLREHGVDVGTFRGSVDSERLAVEMLTALPQLKWFAINVHGTRAEVLVRERTEKPMVYDMDEPMMVYATRTGVVTRAVVLSGTALCSEGDVVVEGDILVTGVMESETANTRFVRALAEVYAVTEHDLTATTPLITAERIKTGAQSTRWSVEIGKISMKFYLNTRILWPKYVKIDNERDLALPTGGALPLSLRKTTIEEYILREKTLTEDEAKRRLEQELMTQLSRSICGSILETGIEYRVSGGMMTAHLHATCEELISAERPFSATEYSTGLETDTDG